MTRRFTSAVADPGQRGREFGAVHAREVRVTADAYLRLFAATRDEAASGDPGRVPSEVRALGNRALARVEEWAPELGAEIRGIAAGAGLDPAIVAAINARTEILASLSAVGTASECSTVVGPGAGGAVAAQNWDWYAVMSPHWLEWTIPYPDGRVVTTVTEYGMVGKIGINERGLGTLFNILHHRDDGSAVGGSEIGVPVHVVARRILDTAASLVDARAVCASASTLGISASTAITIVDGAAAVSLELWPGGVGEVHPDPRGLLLRTNHFLSDPAREGDTWRQRGSDTMSRYTELSRRLGEHRSLDPAMLREVLSDHPSGLCCHPDPTADPRLGMATLATVVLDLAGRALRVSAGSPCQTLAAV